MQAHIDILIVIIHSLVMLTELYMQMLYLVLEIVFFSALLGKTEYKRYILEDT